MVKLYVVVLLFLAACSPVVEPPDMPREPPQEPPTAPLAVPEHIVSILMLDDNSRVAKDTADIEIFTDATDGFLLLEVNQVTVGVGAVDPAGDAMLPALVEQLPNANLQTNIQRFTKIFGPFFLTTVPLPAAENEIVVTLATFENGELVVVDQDRVITFKDQTPTRVNASDPTIYNVTFNNTVIARLNATMYGTANITRARVRLQNGSSAIVPYNSSVFRPFNVTFVNGTSWFTNGTFNTSNATTTSRPTAFNGQAKLWLDMKFEDITIPAGFTDWRWIQVVMANFPPVRPPHVLNPPITSVDPPRNIPGEDDEPFYYNNRELAQNPGLKHRFIDHPGVPRFIENGQYLPMAWSAELCHVGVKAGADVILQSCVTYGFSVNPDGSITTNELTNTGAPSQTFRDTLARDFPGYSFT